MTKRMIGSLALWTGFVVTGTTLAEPLSYKLPDDVAAFRPGPGVEVAQSNCLSCHSADYINFQPPKKGQAFWEAEVKKMIKVYQAPIDEKDAKTIVDYLGEVY
jgi:sulfite dehydrogenase (cytochrome) subunit B